LTRGVCAFLGEIPADLLINYGGNIMKVITGILGVLAFVLTAYAADDTMPDGAKSMGAETTESATPATAPAAAPVSGTVARAAVTSGIENHEPVDNLTKVTADTDKLYYFTELRDMEGQKVIHRWEHNGEVVAEVPFEIGGPRWRVYSSKNLLPGWTGEWKVSVVAANGEALSTNTFSYNPAPESSTQSSATSKEMTGTGEQQPSQAPSTQ
jgi:Protein of unknown function (DUF2914)